MRPLRGSGGGPDDEHGTGMVATIVGVAVFFVLLACAAQLLVHLYATSVVTAAAFDAARLVSAAEGDRAQADAVVATLLGRYGDRVSVAYGGDADTVTVTVTVDNVRLALDGFDVLTNFNRVTRSVTVRREQFDARP